MTYNAQLAGETLSHLVALGVKDFVVCAGARNAPIVTSLLAVEVEKDLQVFHHFDERSAAFFALGLAKSSGVPAAVLTTSGTAVAELHGAVIEAFLITKISIAATPTKTHQTLVLSFVSNSLVFFCSSISFLSCSVISSSLVV